MPSVKYLPDGTVIQSDDPKVGVAPGTAVPVEWRGKRGTVPIEKLQAFLAKGGTAIDQKQEAAQKEYGGPVGQAIAGVEGLARGISPIAEMGAIGLAGTFGGEHGARVVQEHLQKEQAANPVTAGVGEAVGMVAPAFLSGGTSTLAKVVEGTGSGALSELGGAVERGAAKLMGEEATSLGGKVLQKGAALAARGAVEGGIIGATSAIDESALGNTDLTGEKLLGAVGHGALLGGVVGGGLGATGEALKGAIGEIAPRLEGLAAKQAVKALGPTAAELKEIPDIERLGKRLFADKVISGAEKLEEIAPKVEAGRAKAGQALGDIEAKLDATIEPGAAGPKLQPMLDGIDRHIDKLMPLQSVNKGTINKLEALKDDLIRASDGEGFKFSQARQIRKMFDDTINWKTEPTAAIEAIRGSRAAIEGEIESAADAASKKVGGNLLEEYKAGKEAFQDYNIADKIASKGAARQATGAMLGLKDYIVGTGGALGALAMGHPALAASAIGGAFVNKIIRQRGAAFAATMLDRISDIGGVAKATEAFERNTNRAINEITDTSRKVASVPKEVPTVNFKARRDAVLAAAKDMNAHAANVAQVAAPIARYAPQTAGAFQRAALRATNYLASRLPGEKPGQSLIRDENAYEPSVTEQETWNREYDALHDPPGVLRNVANGSVTPDEVKALAVNLPTWYKEQCDKLVSELGSAKDIPYDRQVAITLFLQRPVGETTAPDFIQLLQSTYQNKPSGPAPQPKGKGIGARGGAPKRKLQMPEMGMGAEKSI